jgi:hypothetical protein
MSIVNFVDNNNNNQQQSHSLHNIDNYKSDYSASSTEIFTKYIGVVSEYFNQCSEMINIPNENYYRYVINKGLETITHVFKMLLLYTKNLQLTYYHCQKSFYYYVEFISQIGENNHSFLQLNSKDASLFVYKKTIYELNQEYRKSFSSTIQDNTIMNNVELLICIYKRMLNEKIENMTLQNRSILNIDRDAIKLSQIILNLSLFGNENVYLEKLQLINHFDEIVNWENKNKQLYMDIFIKKLKKVDVNIEQLNKRIKHEDNYVKFETFTPLRYINWLLC